MHAPPREIQNSTYRSVQDRNYQFGECAPIVSDLGAVSIDRSWPYCAPHPSAATGPDTGVHARRITRPCAVIQRSPKRPWAGYAPLLLKFSKTMPDIAAINPIALTTFIDSPNQTKPITTVSTTLLPAQAAYAKLILILFVATAIRMTAAT